VHQCCKFGVKIRLKFRCSDSSVADQCVFATHMDGKSCGGDFYSAIKQRNVSSSIAIASQTAAEIFDIVLELGLLNCLRFHNNIIYIQL